MTEKVLLIKTTGQMQIESIDSDDFLHGLQRLVSGHIETLALSHDMTLIVNEEGLLLDLDYNPVASQFMNMHLVGDVVLCCITERDGELYLCGLTPVFVDLARQILEKRPS